MLALNRYWTIERSISPHVTHQRLRIIDQRQDGCCTVGGGITSLGKIKIQYSLVRWAEARLRGDPAPVTVYLHTKIIPLNFSPSLKPEEEGNKRGKRREKLKMNELRYLPDKIATRPSVDKRTAAKGNF